MITAVVTRGSCAADSACKPPQLQPDAAISVVAILPLEWTVGAGILTLCPVDRVGQRACQRCRGQLRAGRWSGGLGGFGRGVGLRLGDRARRDDEVTVRGDLQQVVARTRTVCAAAAIAEDVDPELGPTQRTKIRRAVDDMIGQVRSFLEDRGVRARPAFQWR
ncbi:hypothetical protein NHF48_011760 [Sphingomonas sp. H160509]|uniref:hypothetical protein n=1 Tax=Sphingomonas sp. H160509 TaxID=2955313 RepID=UPI00209742A1|nr:hypothetical protein [Sphingomonas sp. H160509]MDD1451498.1 hypothetical protein [Sphingomonas sp. H160509]